LVQDEAESGEVIGWARVEGLLGALIGLAGRLFAGEARCFMECRKVASPFSSLIVFAAWAIAFWHRCTASEALGRDAQFGHRGL